MLFVVPRWCQPVCLLEQAEQKQAQALNASCSAEGGTSCPEEKLPTQVVLPPITSLSQGLNISLKTLQCLGNQLNGLSVQLLMSQAHYLAF